MHRLRAELETCKQVVGGNRSQLVIPGTALAQFSMAVQECVMQREAAAEVPFIQQDGDAALEVPFIQQDGDAALDLPFIQQDGEAPHPQQQQQQ